MKTKSFTVDMHLVGDGVISFYRNGRLSICAGAVKGYLGRRVKSIKVTIKNRPFKGSFKCIWDGVAYLQIPNEIILAKLNMYNNYAVQDGKIVLTCSFRRYGHFNGSLPHSACGKFEGMGRTRGTRALFTISCSRP